MLKIFLDDLPYDKKIIHDVEKGFSKLQLKCTEKEKKLVQTIEQGQLLDSVSFIDRFGYKLYLSELSTGCKAALCVLNYKDIVIDLVECGRNARDAIITLCDEGAILMNTDSASVSWDPVCEPKIDVTINNYCFSSIQRLNDYIFNEFPHDADLRKSGIKVLHA